MILAGLLGQYLSQIATAQMTNEFIELIVGIIIGLL